MSAHLDETMGDLRDLLDDIRNEAEHTGYGIFPGGDPRTFTPDPDACTPEEIARWKTDCELAERGEKPTTRTCCESHRSDDGKVMVRLTPSGYGLGTYTMTDERATEWAERLERAIGQLVAIAEEGE